MASLDMNAALFAEKLEGENGAEIKLTSNGFAKGVYVDFDGCDPRLSDNFIDLVNKEPYIIKIETDVAEEELKKSISVKTVYDIGR